ncbi:MAG: sigma-70 family RNA polymerase sigma factor [Haloechinothrix sp.]
MDDGELARRAADGDRGAWAAIYDRYADRLHDYCHSILRDRNEAADALHDAFVTATTKIGQLRDPERLRPWLYAICRTQALAAVRRSTREMPSEDVAEMSPPVTDRADYVDAELRQLVADAAGGLEAKDRAVLDLHLRHGFQGKALGEALGVSPHQATVQLGRVRGHVERSLAALLVGRTGRPDCAELNDLLDGWDGRLSPLIRKRVARHIDRCEVCGQRRRRMVSPLALLATLPLVPAPAELRDPILDDIALTSATTPLGTGGSSGVRAWSLAAGFAALLLVGGVIYGLQRPWLEAGAPTGLASGPTDTASPQVATPAAPMTTTVAPAQTATRLTAPTTRPTATTGPQRMTTTITTLTQRDVAPPVISDLSTDRPWIAYADDTCATTTASATVVDDSPPVTVVLVWRQGADTEPQQAPMTESGESTYTATLGPVGTPGGVVWWVIATDSVGNTATSAEQKLPVERSCEVIG